MAERSVACSSDIVAEIWPGVWIIPALSLSVFDRIFSSDFWFLSEKVLVSRSVSVASRSSSSGALASSAPSPPCWVGITGTPSGQTALGFCLGQTSRGAPLIAPVNWTLETPVKLPWTVAVVPTRIITFSSTAIRTRTKLGSLRHSSICLIWPTGTPEKLTCEPLDRPSTDWPKKMSYSRWPAWFSRTIQTMAAASNASSASVTAPTQT